MKNYKLVHETPEHFVLHDGKSHFHVAKSGIDVPTTDKIRALADGGIAQSPDEAGTEAVEKKNRALTSQGIDPQQSNDEIEVEAQEKAKRQPASYAHGGKLTAEDRAHIAPKNFALPGGRYPIEDANHARNALARVSQHGSSEEKAQVRSKVHSKYPGIEQSKADGGEIEPQQSGNLSDDVTMYAHGMDNTDPDQQKNYQNIKQISNETGLPKFDDGGQVSGAQTFQDSFRKATHYADGGSIEEQNPGVPESLDTNFKKPQTQQSDPTREQRYQQIRDRNTHQATSGDYNNGPIQSYAQGGSIENETQDQAIKRYADGNPATLSKGGHVHNNGGKNQLHFHFYDGSSVPNFADGGSVNLSSKDIDPDAKLNVPPSTTPLEDEINKAAADQATPTPADSANNLAATMGKPAPFNDNSSVSNDSTQPAPNTTPSTAVVPPAQQISAVAKPSNPTPDQNAPNLLSNLDQNLALEKEGIEKGAQAQTAGYQATAKAIGENQLEQKARMDAYKIEADKLTQQNTDLFNSVAASKVDPNHFWNNKTTGGKIMASIGILLGGIAGGANGTNQNQVMTNLQNHIQQDIEAQKNDQSNKMNLYKMGLERYRDGQAAEQFATLQSNALLQGTLQKIAAQTGAPQAQATAQQMIGQIGVQNAQLRSDLAVRQAAIGAMNSPSPQMGVDPNKMRLLINGGIIPKEEVAPAMKEYGDYNKLKDTLAHTEDVFKQAVGNANYTERALPDWFPTIRDSSKKYEAITNAWLGNITKDTEGRVTPQDVKLMRTSLPQAGDSPNVVDAKISSIKDMIKQKYNFPTLQTYKLVHPTDPVIQPGAVRRQQFNEGPPK